jgi:hypothetical protein
VVDKTKIPTGLVVDRVWIPMFDSDPRRPIAYVGDRPRRIAGTVMIALGVVLCGAVVVANSAVWVAFVPLLIAWAGVAYAGAGRSGFYEINEDGRLGDYLGRTRPDVSQMRLTKPR